jgi:signal transduction histidine kinase
VFGFLFITPYTWRRIQTSLFEKLDVLGPNLTRLLDYADELDTQNKALDTVQIALNQSNRENERLQEQYERGQNLLAELRNEYNLKKADHEAELKNWENQRQNQDEKIDLLTSQLDQAKEALLQIETLRTKNQIIQNKLVEASEKNRALQEALLRMKTTFDEISATPGIKFDASQDDLEVLSSEESEIHLPAAKKPQDLINPHDFLAQLISDNQNILTEKNINLVTDFHTLPNLIMGDRESIKLIITGLLSNAIKASPNGEQIDLVTTISQSQTGDHNLNIMVTDRGGGLTTQEQNSYFNLIDRVGQPVPGGIGDVEALRNVTRNVRQLNGNLWIKSELSNPTIYHVVIPVFLPLRSEENTDKIL